VDGAGLARIFDVVIVVGCGHVFSLSGSGCFDHHCVDCLCISGSCTNNAVLFTHIDKSSETTWLKAITRCSNVARVSAKLQVAKAMLRGMETIRTI